MLVLVLVRVDAPHGVLDGGDSGVVRRRCGPWGLQVDGDGCVSRGLATADVISATTAS